MGAELLDLAIATARAAGALLREGFATPGAGVGTKSSATDMVSDADRAAEALILERLLKERPDDGVIGEEGSRRDGASGLCWVIDPLDGTTNFLYGIPHFAVSIACEDEVGALAAVVYDVMADELFAARRSEGATRNGQRIDPSKADSLSRALVATGFSYDPGERAQEASLVPLILPHVRDLRRCGSAALDLAHVACGRVDAYYERTTARWDVAAGSLICSEAGAIVDDLPDFGRTGAGRLAATPGVYDVFRNLLLGAIEELRSRPNGTMRRR